ncbi:MAG: LysE family translocator [Rikenellaceae bacterium]|nr:LysE family translocator [Rikenellaceae bacterium]
MEILGFIAVFALLTLMPGPDILFVLSQGLTRGRKTALAVAAGLASGLLVHSTAAALGFSLIISRSAVLLQAIKYAGVIYLIYLGVNAVIGLYARRSKEASPEKEPECSGSGKAASWKFGHMYRIGVTMNLLNPKVILFFLALFPQFLDPLSTTPKADIFLLGAIASLVALTIFSTLAWVSGYLSDRFAAGHIPPKTMGWINAVIFWAFAVVFLVT